MSVHINNDLSAAELYDQCADTYDAVYSTPEDLAENHVVKCLLQQLLFSVKPQTILDIGAGTGLFLDLFPGLVDATVSIDPSLNMLRVLKRKHPEARIIQGGHELVPSLSPVDLTVSTFSSMSYVPPEDVADTISGSMNPGGSCFLMFASPNSPGSKVGATIGVNDRPAMTAWSVEDVKQLAAGFTTSTTRIFTLNIFTILMMEHVNG
jgi:predicted TPR repeat methyltransferase